jgi:hypothetical protein
MKKIIILGVLAFCLLAANHSFAQISKETLTGKWGIVDFKMIAKNKSGKLTQKEIETVKMMKQEMLKKPKFLIMQLKEDGTGKYGADSPDNNQNLSWELKNDILSLKTGKQTEKYTIRILENGNLEMQALKSKVALPVMTFEKD